MEFHPLLVILAVIAIAFAINLPLGFWRAGQRKYSWRWFLAIHLSVPVVFVLRTGMGVSLWFIPLLIAAAIGGQLLGGAIRG